MNVARVTSSPSRRPATARIAFTVSASSSWFLGENASIDGATIQTFSRSSPSHTNSSREKTYAWASST